MAGIYIHIPFCKQACHYCNFHFSTSLRYKNDFVAALLKEMDIRKEYLDNESIETLYFGGGTPSLLNMDELTKILETLSHCFTIDGNAEITLEANPDDISIEKLRGWKQEGINRLSIGTQSFFEEDLIEMNRAHHAQQAIDSIQSAQAEGFDNINVDLIYGSPSLSNERWKQNLEIAIRLGTPHLSCYALTVEPKTPLDKMIRQKKAHATNPDQQAGQYSILMDLMKEAGYEHYEISNFAKPSKRSRHNTSYWKGEKYLGLGPAAHSYNGIERAWNIANNQQYIQSIKENKLASEKEILTQTQMLNEYIMVSLRTMEGCNLQFVESKFGKIVRERLYENAKPFFANGTLQEEKESMVLTTKGKFLADGIASDLFFDSL
ncbi:MAG: radical SAM family heme chaperone HemW [Bacteroidetes bacterium]|nr:radical SAM family heme chaperone HemW [Bacteroidota bacterium]